jgi:hypothetical protein
LKLLTLDADDTIYADGGVLDAASPMIPLIIKCMRLGITVALVTAAGYPGEPHKFEARIAGLLRAFATAVSAAGGGGLCWRLRPCGAWATARRFHHLTRSSAAHRRSWYRGLR